MVWKLLPKPCKTTTKWSLKKKENENTDIFHFEEKKWEGIGIMSSVFLIYLEMHHSHNSHIVFNLVIKQTVAPRQLIIHINQ